MSLSTITVSGTLIKDPEKRFTPTNIAVTNLTLEVTYIPRGSQLGQEGYSSQVIRVNAWRDLAEECEKKLKTGDKILVIGKAQINAYTTQEGRKKRDVEIDASSIVPLHNILSIKLPVKKTMVTSEKESKSSFKKSSNTEESSNLDEMVSTTEEIPF